MITLLIDALRQAQLSPSAEDIADMLWLAATMPAPSITRAEEFAARAAAERDPQHKTPQTFDQQPGLQNQAAEDYPLADESSPPTNNSNGVGTYLPDTQNGRTPAQAGLPLRLPGTTALPDALNLVRALRPLKRRRLSRTLLTIDEAATVQQSADSRSWSPVLRPVPERWLELVLVVDESPSMILWRQTVVEFRQLLERLGAFRTVETWYFASHSAESPLLVYPSIQALANARDARQPKQLLAPQGQRLILLISDCVGQSWHQGEVTQIVNQWGKSALVGLVQVLPHALWHRTALRQATPVHLRAQLPGRVNAQLEVELPHSWRIANPMPDHLPLPVVALEPDSLTAWVRLLVSGSDQWSPGVILPDKPPKDTTTKSAEQEQTQTPQQLIQHFHAVASPPARELAGYLATAPLSLPLMRLVQRVMLPQTSPAHLAEVMFSGLLRQTTPYTTMLHSDDVRYDFVAGVRDRLLDGLWIEDGHKAFAPVFNALSAFINRQTGKPIEFQALLADPTLLDTADILPDSLPFAMIGVNVLKRWGGNYRQLASLLNSKLLRRSYIDTPVGRRLNREREANEVIALLEETIRAAQDETRRDRSKRLFLIQGDAGVGKSWFMEYLQSLIETRHPTWHIAGIYQARSFVEKSEKISYNHFLMVLRDCDRVLQIHCLDELPNLREPTLEEVAQWAGRLEEQLNKEQAAPLLLFFDELEWWAGIDESQREILNQFWRIVWQMLLREAHIPCIIICAGRRAPSFNNPLLRLALNTYKLNGFAINELEKLIEHHPDINLVQPYIERNAQGNPWITQLLDSYLPSDRTLFQGEVEEIRKKIFTEVVGARLEPELSEVLYKLAQQQPDSIHPEAELLPEGHTTLNRLIASSFVEFNADTRSYVVAPGLASLFTE